MNLKPEEKKKMEAYFNTEAPHLSCPLCARRDWAMSDEVSTITVKDKAVQIANVICGNCGFVMQHKAHL